MLSVASWSACRQVTVCEDAEDCSTPPLDAADAGMAGQPAPASANGGDAGATHQPVENGGVAGQVEPPGAGSSAGGESPQGPSCRPGTAECDDSSLTVCETPTTFSFRHCGGCGKRCEGSCISGNCKPGVGLLDRAAEAFVADSARAFALVSNNVYSVDLESGDFQLIAPELESWATLVLGPDYLYVSYDDHVLRMGFDGSGLASEPYESTSFGVTKDGVYYTTYLEGSESEPSQYELWFRPAGSSIAELLRKSTSLAIAGSTRASIVVREEGADVTEVLLVRGRDVSELGPQPSHVLDLEPMPDAVVFLVENDQVPSGHEVVWLDSFGTSRRFAVEPDVEDSDLVPAPDGVALLLKDRSNTFVRLYHVGGPVDVPFGISNWSTLLYVDERYIWYSALDTISALTSVRRARQFEFTDAIPDE